MTLFSISAVDSTQSTPTANTHSKDSASYAELKRDLLAAKRAIAELKMAHHQLSQSYALLEQCLALQEETVRRSTTTTLAQADHAVLQATLDYYTEAQRVFKQSSANSANEYL